MNTNYLILSCDGGGIRGLITAFLIQDLNDSYNILDKVDLYAGTSTGGLLSVALANDIPIENLIDMYMTKGADIFKPYDPGKKEHNILTKAVEELEFSILPPWLKHVKYNNTGLKEILGTFYSDGLTLANLNHHVFATTFQLYNTTYQGWVPMYMSNLPKSPTADIKALDASLCTSAAPLYFPPHKASATSGYCVDGGVFANNPSLFAFSTVIASGILAEQQKTFDNIRVLSLGTGITKSGITEEQVDKIGPLNYGAIAWLFPFDEKPTPSFPLLEILMDGSMEVDTDQSKQVLGDHFTRGNVVMTKNISMDDYTKVKELRQMAKDYMATAEWQQLKEWVKENFV
jgi:patatin-like phospholipase/acyl hydrolase